MNNRASASFIPPDGIRRLGILLLCFSFNLVLFAHDPGLSVTTVRLEQTDLHIHLAMSPTDVQYLIPVDSNHDAKISLEEVDARRPELERMARAAFQVKEDGQIIPATNSAVSVDNTGAVIFDATYPGHVSGALSVRSVIINGFARGHREFLSIRAPDDRLLGQEMLDVIHNSCAITVTASASPPVAQHSFRDFLTLGIMHIATGYDHILFLLGLLIVGGSFKSALKIITAFTVAHSITLALATMNLINISPAIIEPMIAVSIIYVGVENIFRHNMQNRWLLAFGFGLVHGCGFASALRDLGIGSDGNSIIVPLVSFNLGVEICQMTIAAVVLPLIWKLRERPQFVLRFVPAASSCIALAGTWWFLQRTVF